MISRRCKAWGIVGLVCVFGILIAWRIYDVNRSAEPLVIQTYEMGQFVPLERDYFLEEYEIAEGYEMRVDGGDVLTYSDFLKKYEADPSAGISEENAPDMIYDVQVTVKNTNQAEEEYGIDFFNYWLCAPDYALKIEADTFSVANKGQEEGNLRLRLRPQSEMVFHLPYEVRTEKKSAYLDEAALTRRDIYFVLSFYPVQKQVLVHAAESIKVL